MATIPLAFFATACIALASAASAAGAENWRAITTDDAAAGEWNITTFHNGAYTLIDPTGVASSGVQGTLVYGPEGSHRAVLATMYNTTFILVDPIFPRVEPTIERLSGLLNATSAECSTASGLGCGGSIAACAVDPSHISCALAALGCCDCVAAYLGLGNIC